MINVLRDEMPVPIVGFGHSLGACQMFVHPTVRPNAVLNEKLI